MPRCVRSSSHRTLEPFDKAVHQLRDYFDRLIAEGSDTSPDIATFRLSRFAEGTPIRGTYGDWLMC